MLQLIAKCVTWAWLFASEVIWRSPIVRATPSGLDWLSLVAAPPQNLRAVASNSCIFPDRTTKTKPSSSAKTTQSLPFDTPVQEKCYNRKPFVFNENAQVLSCGRKDGARYRGLEPGPRPCQVVSTTELTAPNSSECRVMVSCGNAMAHK